MKSLLSRYIVTSDPVYGYIKIYDHEVSILESEAFQRLRRIKHLGVTDYAYPGATYTTFLHSIGTAHIVENMVREVLVKADVSYDDIERYVVLLRLILLLHDVGYGPYTYVFEEAILEPRQLTHEGMGARIAEEFNEISVGIEKALRDYGYTYKHVIQAINSRNIDNWPFRSQINSEINEKVLFHFFKGAFSANTIDRVLRDSYYTGAIRSVIDWRKLLYYTLPYEDGVVFDSRATDILEQILITKMRLLLHVYYDSEVRSTSIFCRNVLKKLDQEKLIDFDAIVRDVYRYLTLDDYTIFSIENVRYVKEVKSFTYGRNPYVACIEYYVPREKYFKTDIDINEIKRIVVERIRDCGTEIDVDSDLFIDVLNHLMKLIFKEREYEISTRYGDGSIVKTKIYDFLPTLFNCKVVAFRVYVKRTLSDKVCNMRYKIISSIDNEIGVY
ncbi:MAG: HD domain-containing protein [Ignisphaera sp.]